MTGGKQTLRQKLIGLMYLVLLAMLALNVSVEVLDAFIVVDAGLTKTTENFARSNETTYGEFAMRYIENPQRVGPWKYSADQVKEMADELYNYIQDHKFMIIRATGRRGEEAISGGKIDGNLIRAKENTSIPSNVMLDANRRATLLKEKIETFREEILEMVDPRDVGIIQSINTNLYTNDPPVREGVTLSWEEEKFYSMPVVAAITILSKMQADVRNAESDIINYLLGRVDEGSFMFNALEATVVPRSNYVFRGDEFQAQVFVAAYDTTQAPEILIGQYRTIEREDGTLDYEMVGRADTLRVEQGKGVFRARPASSGYYSWGGLIRLRGADGSVISRPFRNEYQVAEPSLIVSPTRMNVLYRDIDNPVEISVPGLAADQINASVNNGSIRRVSGSSFIVVPGQAGSAEVSVTASINGSQRQMGSMPFRVRNVPDPVAQIAGREGGVISRNVLLAQTGVLAVMKDFDFDLEFTVTGFTVESVQREFVVDARSNSNRITEEQREIIRNAARNQRVLFDDIMAVGPDGEQRRLPPISFRID